MEVEFVKQEKDEVELRVDNQTVAELLRVYLNEQGVKFAAWRVEHPSKPIVFKIHVRSGTVKRAVSDAISAINKDLGKLSGVLKRK